MITDHTKSQQKLKVVAARTNVIFPDQATAKNTATYARLAKLSGPDLDRAYMNEMVQGHTQAVSLFKSKAKAAPDAGVRMFAQATLPILEEHLKLAHQTAVQIGATSRR